MASSYTYHRGKRVSICHAAMLKAYEHEHGPVEINDGQRTIADQWARVRKHGLYNSRTNPTGAAYPTLGAPHIKWGRQHHALDAGSWADNFALAKKIAAFYHQHGIRVAFNVSTEAWHMDVLDEQELKRAVAKLGDDTGDPVLKVGSKGPSVIRLKKLLWDSGIRGYSRSPTGKPSDNRYDPYFGENTRRAVLRLQTAHKLTEDGVVGKSTWRALRAD